MYTPDKVTLLSSEENRLKGTVRLADEETKADVEMRMVEALNDLARTLASHGGMLFTGCVCDGVVASVGADERSKTYRGQSLLGAVRSALQSYALPQSCVSVTVWPCDV